MSDSMIERVARALERVFSDHAMQYQDGHASIEDWAILSRAAIEAMREPTKAMLSAGHMVENDDDAISNWARMIDAALKD